MTVPRGATPMSIRRLFPLLTLLVGWSVAHAAEPSVQSRRSGDAIEVSAEAELAADADRAWVVLTDYEAYPGFIPGLAVSRVVRRQGAELVLEQKGEVALWWWRMPQAVRLAVVETPPHLVRSRLLSGTVQEMEGRYELTPVAAGVRLTYSGRFVLAPSQRGLLDQWMVRRTVSSQFRALIAEIERRARGDSEAPADGT